MVKHGVGRFAVQCGNGAQGGHRHGHARRSVYRYLGEIAQRGSSAWPTSTTPAAACPKRNTNWDCSKPIQIWARDSKRRATDIYNGGKTARRRATWLLNPSSCRLKTTTARRPWKKQGKIALIGPLANSKLMCWARERGPHINTTRSMRVCKARSNGAVALRAGLQHREWSYGNDGAFIGSSRGERREGESRGSTSRGRPTSSSAPWARRRRWAANAPAAAISNSSMCSTNCWRHWSRRANLSSCSTMRVGPPCSHGESRHPPAIMNVVWRQRGFRCHLRRALRRQGAERQAHHVPCHRRQVRNLYYNHQPTGRPVAEGTKTFTKFTSTYFDVRNDALYPFGFGMSYTTFKYGDLRLSADNMTWKRQHQSDNHGDKHWQLWCRRGGAALYPRRGVQHQPPRERTERVPSHPSRQRWEPRGGIHHHARHAQIL